MSIVIHKAEKTQHSRTIIVSGWIKKYIHFLMNGTYAVLNVLMQEYKTDSLFKYFNL